MATEVFQPDRLLFGIAGTADVYRDAIVEALSRLGTVPLHEAEHLVAVSGEDERAYGRRIRESHLSTLISRIDEFLADDEGGYYRMRVLFAASDKSPAMIEIWFNVGRPGAVAGGTWFRHLVIGLDEASVYADMGPAA